MKLREYVLNRTCDFLQKENKDYNRLYWKHVDLGVLSLTISGMLYNTNFRNSLLALTGILVGDMAVRALRGNHGKRAVSGLVGLTREIYDMTKQHL